MGYQQRVVFILRVEREDPFSSRRLRVGYVESEAELAVQRVPQVAHLGVVRQIDQVTGACVGKPGVYVPYRRAQGVT